MQCEKIAHTFEKLTFARFISQNKLQLSILLCYSCHQKIASKMHHNEVLKLLKKKMDGKKQTKKTKFFHRNVC